MKDYGPSRGECWFRIVVGIGGLCLIAGVLFARGMPSGPAMVEVGIFGGLFFGGTMFFAVRRLLRMSND